MFVPDKAKSLKEVARVLKPGGIAYISVWKKLPFYDITHEAMEKVVGKGLAPFAINPLALMYDEAVEELAINANLELLPQEIVTYGFNMGTVSDFVDNTRILSGDMLNEIEAKGDTSVKQKYDAAIRKIV